MKKLLAQLALTAVAVPTLAFTTYVVHAYMFDCTTVAGTEDLICPDPKNREVLKVYVTDSNGTADYNINTLNDYMLPVFN